MQFLERFDTFLLDLDGVVYVGSELLPGALEALTLLRREGKRLRFLTNDPRPTRKDVRLKLRSLGVAAEITEIITSGWATASYLGSQDIRSAYVVGSDGLRQELEEVGVDSSDADEVEAVVVGCDEHVGYTEICRAARLVRQGARFIATNSDASFPTPQGPAPATGTIVAAVQTACAQRPRIIGKPYPAMFKTALADCEPHRSVMIGDSIESDICGARRVGIAAVWVRSEATSTTGNGDLHKPDFVIDSLSDVCRGIWK